MKKLYSLNDKLELVEYKPSMWPRAIALLMAYTAIFTLMTFWIYAEKKAQLEEIKSRHTLFLLKKNHISWSVKYSMLLDYERKAIRMQKIFMEEHKEKWRKKKLAANNNK